MWHILQHAQEKLKQRNRAALITLFEAQGSTYRKPGAKMVVDHSGRYRGTISGGCLETDVAQHAQNVLQSRRNQIIHYDLTDDVVFGLGLGCGGSISLLIEQDFEDWLSVVLDQYSESVLVKFLGDEEGKEEPKTLFVYNNGKFIWQDKNQSLDKETMELLETNCKSVLSERMCSLKEFHLQGKQIRVYFDYVEPAPALVIFGAGDDALPVALLGQQLNFQVTVIDYKPANLEEPRFQGCKKLLWSDSEQPLPSLTKRSAVVIMSHHVQRDALALEIFRTQDVEYIGLLGPKHRLQRLEEHLKQLTIEEIEQDERIYTPVGLDIGSETPAEIAVSILSEIIAVRNKAKGMSLREKKGSIHQ